MSPNFLLFAEQIELTPKELVTKIMANPEVAVAFQDPKVTHTKDH